MPVVLSERISPSTKSPAFASTSAQSKLRGITEIELRAWRRAVNDPAVLSYDFLDLHEIFDYPFKDHDSVWVPIKDQWCLGRVAGRNIRIGPTRNHKQGFYYPVVFGKNRHIRKYFSPSNGEIKPDNEKIRGMLMHGGWLYKDENSDQSSSEDNGSR